MEEKRDKKQLGELRESAKKLTNLLKAFEDAGEIIDELAIHESSAASRKTNLRHEINELEGIRDKAKAEAKRALKARDDAAKSEKDTVAAAATKANNARTEAETAHLSAKSAMELEMKQVRDKHTRFKEDIHTEMTKLGNRRDVLKSEVTNAEARRKKLLADLGVGA